MPTIFVMDYAPCSKAICRLSLRELPMSAGCYKACFEAALRVLK